MKPYRLDIWPVVKAKIHDAMKGLYAGDIRDPKAFLNAVIDRAAFDRVKGYIDAAKEDPDAEILEGGVYDDSVGYFIQPTVILAKKPDYRSMVEEIFGPVFPILTFCDRKEVEDFVKFNLLGKNQIWKKFYSS